MPFAAGSFGARKFWQVSASFDISRSDHAGNEAAVQGDSKAKRRQKNVGRKMKAARFARKGGRGALFFCPGYFCLHLRERSGVVFAGTVSRIHAGENRSVITDFRSELKIAN
jgi:hypothetical protein